MSEEELQLDQLEQEAEKLRKTRNELFRKISKYRDERDTLNESSKKLREQALVYKEERDKINLKIQMIKKNLNPLFQDLEKVRQKVNETEKALRTEYNSRPSKSKVKKDLQRTEWEIMTTPTREIMNREDQLIKKAIKLRKTLEEFNTLEKQKAQNRNLLAQEKATENEIASIRNEIQKLANHSQEHHQKMLELYNKADDEKEKADEMHKYYVRTIQEVEEIKIQINTILNQIKALKTEIKTKKVEGLETRRILLEQRIEQKREEALRKMENGEKLTFEDMKLIYGEEQ
jgi:uncharacterized coiled-coil DUF342 family protein